MKSDEKKANVRKENMMQGRNGILTITTEDGFVYYQYITKKEAVARKCGSQTTILVPNREIYDSQGHDIREIAKKAKPKLVKTVKMNYNEGDTLINTEAIIDFDVYLG
jgi:spermidine/putrescine-binding protein